ncbi:MAG: M23 family metallopeptidase [Desulfatibacillaceae bacterium]
MNLKAKNLKIGLISIVCLAVIAAAVWFAGTRLEGAEPDVTLNSPGEYLGRSTLVEGNVQDPQNGLRSLKVSILGQDGREVVLVDEQYDRKGFLAGGSMKDARFSVEVSPREAGLEDGPAIIRIAARDYSFRDWGNGNLAYRETPVTVDTTPPRLVVLSRQHYISQGGAGLVVYRVDEEGASSGVRVGERFYKGYPAGFNDSDVHLAFFAVAHDQSTDTSLRVEARDKADNTTRAGFYYRINARDFRQDTINISDDFIRTITPQFTADNPEAGQGSPLDRFLYVNRTLREQNYLDAMAVADEPDAKLHWEGRFLRLPNAANRARFADHRNYVYKGEVVDRQVHLGVDLASLARSEVPAGNAGRVAFAGPMGIYGITVFLDHGFGLYSQYSHLSEVTVNVGDQVAKGDIIGRTGATGLAGGDHLHYGMMVQDTFVNPIEWWDPNWIRNNITSKTGRFKPS